MGQCQGSLKGIIWGIICFFFLSLGAADRGVWPVWGYLRLESCTSVWAWWTLIIVLTTWARVHAMFPYLCHCSVTQLSQAGSSLSLCFPHVPDVHKHFPLTWNDLPCLTEIMFSYSSWSRIVLWFLLNFWAFTEWEILRIHSNEWTWKY